MYFLVYCFFLYYVCYLRVNKDEYMWNAGVYVFCVTPWRQSHHFPARSWLQFAPHNLPLAAIIIIRHSVRPFHRWSVSNGLTWRIAEWFLLAACLSHWSRFLTSKLSRQNSVNVEVRPTCNSGLSYLVCFQLQSVYCWINMTKFSNKTPQPAASATATESGRSSIGLCLVMGHAFDPSGVLIWGGRWWG